jgi:succinate dehydrogenase / fumarate reductase membrane anchor subunit
MSESKNAMRTPLGRVRHTGAASAGTEHFIGQRTSAIALVVLATWFVLTAALTLESARYDDVITFLRQPVNAVGIILLLLAGIFHMRIGMQEVILDYIHKPVGKIALLLLNGLAPIVLGVGAIFAVLLINFGG